MSIRETSCIWAYRKIKNILNQKKAEVTPPFSQLSTSLSTIYSLAHRNYYLYQATLFLAPAPSFLKLLSYEPNPTFIFLSSYV